MPMPGRNMVITSTGWPGYCGVQYAMVMRR